MSDFSSAAMMRLAKAGLARQNVHVDTGFAEKGPHVPLARKRRLLTSVVEAHGPLVILNIGAAITEMPTEPLLTALTLANGPAALVRRWQRLERYVHSRHRIDCNDRTDASPIRLIHRSSQKSFPRPEESLLVFGLLVALLGQLPNWRVSRAAIGRESFVFDGGAWTSNRIHGENNTMDVVCNRINPVHCEHDVSRPAGSEFLAAARQLVWNDPCRRWTLEILARRLAMRPRSFQRRLKDNETTFSKLISSVRASKSALLLTETLHSSAEIGFLCGYADQAHFIRSFKRHAAMTPQVYRNEFAADG